MTAKDLKFTLSRLVRVTIFLVAALISARQLTVSASGPALKACDGLMCTSSSDCGIGCVCDKAGWMCTSIAPEDNH
jgi:hypothetical protein